MNIQLLKETTLYTLAVLPLMGLPLLAISHWQSGEIIYLLMMIIIFVIGSVSAIQWWKETNKTLGATK